MKSIARRARRLLRRIFPVPVATKEIEGFQMVLDLNDGGISSVLFHNGTREACFMSIMDEVLAQGMVAIDLGSNIGYTTLHMLRGVGENGFVYAIEPDPHNVKLLKANIQKNHYMRDCEISECAISDSDGEITFWMADKPNISSVQRTAHSTKAIKVPAYSLTSFLSIRKYPNFIKMDVEGHEVKIFEGGLEYFTQHLGRMNFLVEVHPQFYNQENDFSKILEQYFKIGFYPRYVVSTPVPQPKLFAEAGYTPVREVHTDGRVRGIYENISKADFINFACYEHEEGTSKKIVRSFLLSRD